MFYKRFKSIQGNCGRIKQTKASCLSLKLQAKLVQVKHNLKRWNFFQKLYRKAVMKASMESYDVKVRCKTSKYFL